MYAQNTICGVEKNLQSNVSVEDVERNNGKDQPYFMDEELLDLMDLKNKDHRRSVAQDEEDTALVT